MKHKRTWLDMVILDTGLNCFLNSVFTIINERLCVGEA